MALPPRIPLRRSDPLVRRLLTLTFPDFTGRKIFAQASTEVFLDSTWDGGTGSEWAIINLETNEVKRVPRVSPLTAHMAGPKSAEWQLAWGKAALLPNMVYAEKQWFCSKLIGITFHVHPSTMAKALTETTA